MSSPLELAAASQLAWGQCCTVAQVPSSRNEAPSAAQNVPPPRVENKHQHLAHHQHTHLMLDTKARRASANYTRGDVVSPHTWCGLCLLRAVVHEAMTKRHTLASPAVILCKRRHAAAASRARAAGVSDAFQHLLLVRQLVSKGYTCIAKVSEPSLTSEEGRHTFALPQIVSCKRWHLRVASRRWRFRVPQTARNLALAFQL